MCYQRNPKNKATSACLLEYPISGTLTPPRAPENMEQQELSLPVGMQTGITTLLVFALTIQVFQCWA